MKEKIKKRLKKIEEIENIEIIYAVESGSRAWGFASKDSDWDIRFIYHRPLNQYLKLFKNDDYLGIDNLPNELFQDNLDFHGWDIDKTLKLLHKGNPPLLEWLSSPIIYRTSEMVPELRELAKSYYSDRRAIYHYLHMAENNYKAYIKNKTEVITKKYLYIVRPLLACHWIKTMNSIAPMNIDVTFKCYKNNKTNIKDIIYCIDNLIEQKKAGEELGKQKSDEILNSWIVNQFDYYNKYIKTIESNTSKRENKLNEFYRKVISK